MGDPRGGGQAAEVVLEAGPGRELWGVRLTLTTPAAATTGSEASRAAAAAVPAKLGIRTLAPGKRATRSVQALALSVRTRWVAAPCSAKKAAAWTRKPGRGGCGFVGEDLAEGDPRRSSVQPLVERFEPWYVNVAGRPIITSAPTTIAHDQPLIAQVQLAAGMTLKYLQKFRLMGTTYQFSEAEGRFTPTVASTPSGPGWPVTVNANLTSPGDDLVAVDSRDMPSTAKLIKVT